MTNKIEFFKTKQHAHTLRKQSKSDSFLWFFAFTHYTHITWLWLGSECVFLFFPSKEEEEKIISASARLLQNIHNRFFLCVSFYLIFLLLQESWVLSRFVSSFIRVKTMEPITSNRTNAKSVFFNSLF